MIAAVHEGPYYERYWLDEQLSLGNELARPVRRMLEPHVARRTRCLDVGCGDGRTAGPWVRERGASYVGVDISEEAVKRAREQGLQADVVEDASQLPFDEQTFDVVLCVEVLEHLFDPLKATREMWRVLKRGGALLVTVPNAAYWKRRLESLAGVWNPGGDQFGIEQPWRDPHLRFFTRSSLERMFAAAGFSVAEIGGHMGCLLADTPYVGRAFAQRRSSAVYTELERRLPSLLGLRLHALAERR